VLKIIGMIAVYNEPDIVRVVIDHLLSQGIQLVILDNSANGSNDMFMEYSGKGVLSVERLVTERYDMDLLISKMYEKALEARPDWVLLNDSDVFLESPYPGMSLRDAIELEDRKGHNMIQFDNFEFLPTEKDEDSNETDVRKRLKYYTWNDNLRFLAWKPYPGVTVTGTSWHYPIFPENVKVRVPRTKYIMRHYRIRSYQQGLQKVFSERIPRFPEELRRKGMLVQYDNFGRDKKFFVINSTNLNRYNDDGRWVKLKKFDLTWGHKPIPWAKPPVTTLRERISSTRLARHVAKTLILKRKTLPT